MGKNAIVSVEARVVNTSKFGCRSTRSTRWFVTGVDVADSYERGVGSCAFKKAADAVASAAAVVEHRRRNAGYDLAGVPDGHALTACCAARKAIGGDGVLVCSACGEEA